MRRLLPFLLLATPAAAQDRPPLFPTRDAAVTYRVTGPMTAGRDADTLRIAYLAAERKQRMDVAPNAYVITDRAANRGITVDEGSRTAVRVPLNAAIQATFEPTPDAAFTREREERIAGIPCTNWSYRNPGAAPGAAAGAEARATGRLCLTADGVPLRMEANLPTGLARAEASEVRLVAQDPELFRIPAGYQITDAVPPRRR